MVEMPKVKKKPEKSAAVSKASGVADVPNLSSKEPDNAIEFEVPAEVAQTEAPDASTSMVRDLTEI